MKNSVLHVQFKENELDPIKKDILNLLIKSGFLKNNQDQQLIEQEHMHCFSVNQKNKPIAYALLSVLFEEAEILQVYVLDQFRRKGYAQAILIEVINFCQFKEVKKIFLELRQSNKKAYRLYQKQGFADLSCRKNYYSDGEDAIVMQRSLE
ncbi:ribosomal protein S18-alanine N-acetyltransferase [bacterium]|nr:ribosomal protein S18-alanine N-acetyltransferase [bacterium]